MRYQDKIVAIFSISIDESDDPNRVASFPHLGEVCAKAFAAAGATVVLVDPDERALRELAAQIESLGAVVHTECCNLTQPEALAKAAQKCKKRFERIDAVVCCHSDLEVGGFEEASEASWERVLKYNLLGVVYATKAFLPLLARSAAGAIVYLGSIDGQYGNPKLPSYSVSKGGLIPLMHILAADLGPRGIRVNCVNRAMYAPKDAPVNPRHATNVALTPLGRPALPEEVASAVLYLASEDASYISGSILTVDGGRTGVTPGTFTLNAQATSARGKS